MDKQMFHFELTVEQTNIIMQALSQMPYAQVVALIDTIQTQARGQIQAQQAE